MIGKSESQLQISARLNLNRPTTNRRPNGFQPLDALPNERKISDRFRFQIYQPISPLFPATIQCLLQIVELSSPD